MHHQIKRTEVLVAASILAFLSVPLDASLGQDNPINLITSPFESLNQALDKAGGQRVASASSKGGDGPSSADTSAEATTPIVRVKLTIVLGQSKSVMLEDIAKRVVNDYQELVEVTVNPKNLSELRISGLKPGIAEITVTDRAGRQKSIEVTITQDVSPLQVALSKMVPDANIEVIPVTDQSVLIRGAVENLDSVGPIMDLAKQFYPNPINRLEVVGPQQVQLRVLIAEVSRTKLRAMGFNFLFQDVNGGTTRYFTSGVGGLATLKTDAQSSNTGLTFGGLPFQFSQNSNFTFGNIRSNGNVFRGFLRALKEEGLAKIIDEPTIIAFSGRAAKMNIGGEFPILIPDAQGKVTIEFREFGNKVDVTSIVLGGGRIRLEVRPELSERDDAGGIVFQGFSIPGIKTRYVDTSVELNTGETFVIGGLLSTTVNSTTSKVPVLGDLAIVGTAFRTTSYNQEEKELIIMVTPELVEPLKASQKSCAYPGSESRHPTGSELFLKGNVEGAPCTSCEMARRQQLKLDVGHGRSKGSATENAGVAEGAKDTGTGSEIAAELKAAREAQRPSNLPDLLGPLGYDAGR